MATKVNNRMIDGAVLNVLDFGAKGDGITDDTAAIQAAIDAFGVFGGQADNPIRNLPDQYTLHFPQGKYRTTSTIYCNYHNIHFDMQGIILYDAPSGIAIDMDYNQERRPGTTPSPNASAYLMNHRFKVGKVDREWTTINASPTRYDRIRYDFIANVTSGDTLTINNKVYTFGTDITIGADIDQTIDNIIIALENDVDSYVTTSRTSVQFVIEKGASYLTSDANSSAITVVKFIENDAGVVFGNIWDSEIHMDNVYNFTVGYDFISNAQNPGGFGMETTKIFQGRIDDCQVGGRFRQKNGAYHHDTTVYGGNWKVSGPAGSNTSHYGFVFDNIRASNNTFFHVDHEPTTPIDPTVEEAPSYLILGNVFQNRSLYTRAERATLLARLEQGEIDPGTPVNNDAGPNQNVFYSGNYNVNLEDNTRSKENYANINYQHRYPTSHEIASPWNVDMIVDKTIYDNTTVTGGNLLQVVGWQVNNNATTSITTDKRSSGLSLDDTNRAININNSVALTRTFSNLNGNEEFLITGKSPKGEAGRPFIRAFDNQGNLVTSRDSVIGSIGDVGAPYRIAYNSSRNAWITFGDQTEDLIQRVRINNPDIATIQMGVTGGTLPANISTINIQMRQDAAPVRSTLSYTEPKDTLGKIYVPSTPGASPTRSAGVFYNAETDITGVGGQLLGWRRNDADNNFIPMYCPTS